MNPTVDFHALAPEIVLTAFILHRARGRSHLAGAVALDVVAHRVDRRARRIDPGDHARVRRLDRRELFGGAFVVDNYALALMGFFLVVAYLSLLMSADYIGEGDYYQGEFYFLLLTSVLGMVVMASARDLISIFVALETITIPTFILAGWRKHDENSNEAAIKYFLIGVLSTAIMLYGMSLVYGETGSTLLSGINSYVSAPGRETTPLFAVAIFLTLGGFAFKVERGAVPLLDARHLSGRAHAGHRVPVGRVEGGRVRRDAQHRGVRLLPVARLLAADALDPRGGVDDLRQPRRAPPDQHRPHAGVLVDRAGRVHPRAARGRR